MPWFMPPPIHDISTDLEDPPGFVEAARQRRRWQNAPEHGGEPVANLQRLSYPDIRPVYSRLPQAEAYEKVLRIVDRLGWRVTGEDPGAGRVEALAVTPICRFRDDIIIRIRPGEGGSRVDIRSASRLGRGDLGANARRVRRFLRAWEGEL